MAWWRWKKILPFPVCALSGSNQMNVVSIYLIRRKVSIAEQSGKNSNLWKNCQLVAKVPSGKDQTLFEWDQHGWMLWTNKETGLDEVHVLNIFSEQRRLSICQRWIFQLVFAVYWLSALWAGWFQRPKHLFFSHEGNISILKFPKLRHIYLAQRSWTPHWHLIWA